MRCKRCGGRCQIPDPSDRTRDPQYIPCLDCEGAGEMMPEKAAMIAKSRALYEVESDIQKTFVKLRLAVENPEPCASDWLSVVRLAERLAEEANRAYQLAQQRETLERVKAMQPYGLPGG